MLETFKLVAGLMVLVFVALAVWLLVRESRKDEERATEAARLGLHHERGDALGLGARFAAGAPDGTTYEVQETTWGVVDGVEVAAVLLTKATGFATMDGPEHLATTRTVTVRDPRGACEVVQDMGGWGLKYDPIDASEMEAALRRAARGG